MIRHLVMPNRISGAREAVQWIGRKLPKDTYVNIMSQYTPTYKAHDYPKISRRITRDEYREVVACVALHEAAPKVDTLGIHAIPFHPGEELPDLRIAERTAKRRVPAEERDPQDEQGDAQVRGFHDSCFTAFGWCSFRR